jgi:hypothetical protein
MVRYFSSYVGSFLAKNRCYQCSINVVIIFYVNKFLFWRLYPALISIQSKALFSRIKSIEDFMFWKNLDLYLTVLRKTSLCTFLYNSKLNVYIHLNFSSRWYK